MSGALEGIRILDLSHALAAPSATKLLGDYGAEVIKIEPPRKGDFTRTLVPWVFESFNRNKKSLAVDLKSEEGRAIVHDLARVSDVVVQSFRPGVVEAMGIGREDLSAINPRVIYVSFSGFGQSGPAADRKGVDALIQAETGLALAQGGLLGSLSFVDEAAGLAMASAILAALFKRERTGAVDHLEMTLFDIGLYLQTAPILECSVTGKMLDQVAHAARYPLSNIFQTADLPIYLGLYWDADWQTLCDIADRPDLASDPRFATNADRCANSAELQEAVNAMLSAHPRRFWIDALEKRGSMAGEVRTHSEVLNSDQVAQSNSIEYLETTRGERGAYVRAPAQIVGQERATARPAPQVGANTDEILELIGRSAEARADLKARNIVS